MLHYPLGLSYRHGLRAQVRVTDATGAPIAFVRRKAFQLRGDHTVFADEARERPLYRLRADRLLNPNATYAVTRADGAPVGSVQRREREVWDAISYHLGDAGGREIGRIRREFKMAEALAGVVPVGAALHAAFVNPTYLVELRGAAALALTKHTVIPERGVAIERESTYVLERRARLSEGDEALVLAGVIMALMLELSVG